VNVDDRPELFCCLRNDANLPARAAASITHFDAQNACPAALPNQSRHRNFNQLRLAQYMHFNQSQALLWYPYPRLMRILFAISLVALAALLWASVSIAQHIHRSRRRSRSTATGDPKGRDANHTSNHRNTNLTL
jgi:hypothetical protein